MHISVYWRLTYNFGGLNYKHINEIHISFPLLSATSQEPLLPAFAREINSRRLFRGLYLPPASPPILRYLAEKYLAPVLADPSSWQHITQHSIFLVNFNLLFLVRYCTAWKSSEFCVTLWPNGLHAISALYSPGFYSALSHDESHDRIIIYGYVP